MKYSDVTTQLTSEWNIVNIALPSFFDRNIFYNTMYPGRLFIDVYNNMPITEISKDDVFRREQLAEIEGIYASETDVEKALKEATRCITAKKGWRLFGNASIKQLTESKGWIFKLRWVERTFLRGGEW